MQEFALVNPLGTACTNACVVVCEIGAGPNILPTLT